MTSPSERPILMSTWSVQQILKDLKTQTRRVIKLNDFRIAPNKSLNPKYEWAFRGKYGQWNEVSTDWLINNKSPYGAPGDLLWVRETFCPVDDREEDGEFWIDYRATPKYESSHPAGWDNCPDDPDALKWKPSIYMPKEYARIWLEVQDVRAERVQDITEQDAIAEGIEPKEPNHVVSAPYRFAQLWNSINADPKPVKVKGIIDHYISYPWEDVRETREHRGKPWIVQGNPWVWVVSFAPVTRNR